MAESHRLSEGVANDVQLEPGGLLLLTGPNMSGKSTLMRAVLAAALLVNVGLPVPCESASVPQVRFARCDLPAQLVKLHVKWAEALLHKVTIPLHAHLCSKPVACAY